VIGQGDYNNKLLISPIIEAMVETRINDEAHPAFKTCLETALLTTGSCSATHRLGEVVVRVARIDDDPGITRGNAEAMAMETHVYKILGAHPRIAVSLYLSPIGDMVVLGFYANGNLKDYITAHGTTQLHKWAKQMIEAVGYLHVKGVRHSDIKLSQWLVGSDLNAYLSDFNGCGYDAQPLVGISSMKALSHESPSHFMPRDPSDDNTVKSDLFALGSALYELERGSTPLINISEEKVTESFKQGNFPPVSSLTLGNIIIQCWKGQFNSASEILHDGDRLWLS
jgi:serine/threonine protein kinase